MGEGLRDGRLEELYRSSVLVMDQTSGERLQRHVVQDDIARDLPVIPRQLIHIEPSVVYRVPVQGLSDVLWGLTQMGRTGVAEEVFTLTQVGAVQQVGPYYDVRLRAVDKIDRAKQPRVIAAEETLVGLGTLEGALADPRLGIIPGNPSRQALQHTLQLADLYDGSGHVDVDALWELHRSVQLQSGAIYQL